MSNISAIRIVLSDSTEISVPIDEYREYVRKEFLKFLPDEEIDKNKLYERIGFCLCVLDSIREGV